MKIAYTFDRQTDHVATKGAAACNIYESDENIDNIANTLRSLGHDVELVGCLEKVVKRLSQDPLPDWFVEAFLCFRPKLIGRPGTWCSITPKG